VQLIAAPWREDLALRAAFVLQQAGVAYLSPSPLWGEGRGEGHGGARALTPTLSQRERE
jgi:hypothetical protein